MATALLLPFLCCSIALSGSLAAQPAAVSVDDTSSLLTYDDINHWTTHVNTPAHFNLYDSSDTFSDVQGAWVTFAFNGTSIEYWGNQGPFHGPCLVTLEDGTSQTVNSHYTEDADPILLFSKYDLAPQTHTIKVTVVNASYPNVCEIDRFVYTPLPTTAAGKSSKNSTTFIAVGAAVGAAVILAVVLGLFCWRRRSRRRSNSSKRSDGRGVLDDDLFTAQYRAVPFTLSDGDPQSPPFTPRPPSSSAGPAPTTTLSHTPSFVSSASNAKSIEAAQFSGYNPYTSFPAPPAPGSYPANEKRASTAPSPPPPGADSSTSYSGEGSSSVSYRPFTAPTTSSSHGAVVVQPSLSSSLDAAAGHHHPPVPVVVVPAPVAVAYQHQDAGRVPDEVPPAYKESWKTPTG